MKNDLPLTGSLKQYSFHKILVNLNSKQKRGLLTVTHKNIKKEIYIEEGKIVHAFSNQDKDRLMMLLVTSGKITAQQRDESLKLSQETGKRQGVILVERGYITPKELFNTLKLKIQAIILDLFSWQDGTFSFTEKQLFPDVTTLKISIDSLLRERLIYAEKQTGERNDEFIQKIEELHVKLIKQSLSYYDALEIDVKTPATEIKKVYITMAKRYHPDRHYQETSSELRDKIASIFTFINQAYVTLSDSARRREYDAVILRKVERKPQEDQRRGIDEQFRKGVAEFKRGNYWGAADLLRGLTRKNQHKAAFWAYLSFALINIPSREKEAEETIRKAIELEPKTAQYYMHLGDIYQKAGMNKRAIRQYEVALQWDPVNEKAKRKINELKGETL
jgi:curved DNA-binding protein CbpA